MDDDDLATSLTSLHPRPRLSSPFLIAAILATAVLAGVPETVASQERAQWRAGVEGSRSPGAHLRWEVTTGGWILGTGGTAALGTDRVRLRVMPVLRVGRRLFGGPFRVDGGLGLESVWLEGERNAQEWEIQWELTGGAAWRSRLLAEAGVRRTDYAVPVWEGVARLSFPVRASPWQPSDHEPPHIELPFGNPAPIASSGLLTTGIETPDRSGSGALLAASNPRGDTNPWDGDPRDNIDRLGMSGELWGSLGDTRGWMRLRSDLHTDPSIRERVGPIAEGLPFPLSVALAGGAAWSPPDGSSLARADIRRDFRALRWMPHLGEERTLAAFAVRAVARNQRWAAELEGDRLEATAGTTIDPLDHARLWLGLSRPTGVGVEVERLRITDVEERRVRATVRRAGPIFGAGSIGTGAALTLGAQTSEATDSSASGRLVGAIEARSEPELLDYENLIARGWTRAGTESLASRRPVFRATLTGERSGLSLTASMGWGLPAWVDGGLARERGGRVEAAWHGEIGPVRTKARLRLADWGAPTAWWREDPAFRAELDLRLVDDVLQLSIPVTARTALRSARNGIVEPGGAVLSLRIGVPVPDVGLPAEPFMELRLDDLLDDGLPTRVGAPRLGRRLTGMLSVRP